MKAFLYQIIAAGHICLDISPRFIGTSAASVEEIFIPGKLVNLEGATMSVGGAVANTGFALKKIGLRVKPIANVDKDFFGRALNEVVFEQCAERIDLNEHIITSYSIVLSVPGIDRMILNDPAGNNVFTSNDIDYERVSRAKLFHFGASSADEKGLRKQWERALGYLRKCKRNGRYYFSRYVTS